MSKTCLVTGANGHLGYNLVEALIEDGWQVRCGLRNLEHRTLFKQDGCEVVHTDLHDPASLVSAMQGVDVLFQAAAVFQHWAPDAEKSIVQANVTATENVITAASEAGVSKIVYVSSMVTVSHKADLLSESTWNDEKENPYYVSKIESEKRAWQLAQQHDIWMVSVLPSVIVGPGCNHHLTPSMEVLWKILNNKMPFDPEFHFNYIDVKDVVHGMILALEKGKNGERYLLANSEQTTSTQVFTLASQLYPGVKIPRKAHPSVLSLIAGVSQFFSRFTRKPPVMLKSWVRLYHKVNYRCDISKAAQELGFSPKSPETALTSAMQYVAQI